MSGPLGDFAGVSVEAAGQVYSQNKSAAFVQTVHQPAGGKAGGPQCAMEPGADAKTGSKRTPFAYGLFCLAILPLRRYNRIKGR